MKVPEYRVIIAGSVSFQDYDLLRAKCDAILSEKQRTHNVVVISGTARGADRLGERYAREKGYRLRQFPADWDTHGRSAGPIRNGEMAKNADALIAARLSMADISGCLTPRSCRSSTWRHLSMADISGCLTPYPW